MGFDLLGHFGWLFIGLQEHEVHIIGDRFLLGLGVDGLKLFIFH